MARRRRRRNTTPAYLRAWSAAHLRQEANRRVGDVLDPQIAQQEREARERAATIQAASQAATQLLSQHAGATQDIYRKAASDVQGFGSGYSDAMKARMQAAQDAAAQFAGQQGAPSQPVGTDVGALGDTAYYGGVGIPGSSLESQGATASALANQESGIPLLQGAQDIRASMQDKEKALLELAQQRPELTDKVMEQLYAHEMDKLHARIQQQAQDLYSSQFGEKVRHDVVNEGLSAQRNRISKLRYNEQVRVHNAAIQKAQQEGRNPNASLSRAYGYIVDKEGNPILDSSGKKIKVAKSSSTKSSKDKQNAQYNKAVGEAESMFTDAQPGDVTYPGVPYDPKTNPYKPPKRAWQWGNALRYLMNRYGINRSRARQALVAAGFKPPSGRGPGGTGPR